MNCAASSSRWLALDVLRGFAVFGILVANMSQYFLPELLSDAPSSVYGSTTANQLKKRTTDGWSLNGGFFPITLP